ncbi:hypothetical protein PIIN_11331 [Serendipita indica DSM 11827]|uniref:Uncharacterized protein n=1 Tax=Serendipita indica (strain DSM 11827) TaxID=1109443 RepID=G4U1B1_SERID|nr:hypothetical protein PIIN_11331 [Serendipita indica DSM 11827]
MSSRSDKFVDLTASTNTTGAGSGAMQRPLKAAP